MKKYPGKALFFSVTILLCAAFIPAGAPAEKWRTVRNMEQVVYCVSLPLNGFKEDFEQSDVRGKHVFTHVRDKQRQITIQGMLRSEQQHAKTYFQQYFEFAEEEGKIIDYKKLDAKNNRFYCGGYWANHFYNTRFIEVVWLRKDELVKLEAVFPLKDTTVWKKHLTRLMQQSTNCK